MVTSDRLSAFDVVLAEPIPHKGRVLTAMTAFWVEQLGDVIGNHLLSTDLADCPPAAQDPELAGRVMLCRRAEMLPVECIVRGRLTGSAWKEYKAAGTMHGAVLPAGLAGVRRAARARVHAVDQGRRRPPRREHHLRARRRPRSAPSSPAGPATPASSCSPGRSRWAAERGIVIADTKFELGLVDGELILCDEVLTPDSSRFWPADDVDPGADAAELRQAAGARLPRRPRLGQDPAAAAAARRGRGGDQRPLRRRLRAHHRPCVLRLARRRRLASSADALLGRRSRSATRKGSPTRRARRSSGPCPRSASPA